MQRAAAVWSGSRRAGAGRRRSAATGGAPPAARAQLSFRERTILLALAGGASNSHVARSLGLAEQTVKNHVGHILRKLGAPDRTAAVVLALMDGTLDLDQIELVDRTDGGGGGA